MSFGLLKDAIEDAWAAVDADDDPWAAVEADKTAAGEAESVLPLVKAFDCELFWL